MSQREREKAKAKRSAARTWASRSDSSFSGYDKSVALPEGVEEFRPKKPGTYDIDLVPYIVSDRAEEFEREIFNADPGEEYFERTFFVHKNMGPKEETHTCLLKTFNESCPPCEYVAKHRGDKKLYGAIGPKRRQLWRVRVVDGPELVDPKKVRVWNTAVFKGFGAMIKEEYLALKKEEDKDNFGTRNGLRLRIRFKEDSFEGRTFLAPTKVDFVERDEEIPGSLVKAPPCLDDVITRLSYKELLNIFEKGGSTEDDADERPARGGSAKKPADDDDDDDDGGFAKGDVVEYEGMTCKIVKVNGSRLTLKDEDGEVYSDVAVTDVEKAEAGDDDDDDAPAANGRTSARPAARAKDDDEEEEEDDEEEEEEDDEDEAPAARGGKKPAAKDDDDEDEEEEDDDEDEAPARGKKPAGRKR
jgi:hypothetical protein